jgi:branched-chain amino acid transport system substrate-binding protein
MMRTRKFTVIATLVIALLPTACSSSSPDGDAADQVVTIGVLAPIDGGLTDFGRGIRNGVELAVREANAAGLLPGWTINVRVVDDSSDPLTGEAGATELANDETVVAVVGPYNSGVALAALPVLAQANIALVSPSNTLTDLTLGANPSAPLRPFANYVRMVGSDAMQGEFLAGEALALGYSTAAVVSETKAVSNSTFA